jgi:hypothetical protein
MLGLSADLESLTRNNYASQLDYVLGSTADLYPDIDPWEDSVHRIGKSKEMYTFTVEESKLRRPLGNAGNVSMLDVFKHTRSDCVNIMLPMYKKLLNSDGGAPTGTEKDKIISTLHISRHGRQPSTRGPNRRRSERCRCWPGPGRPRRDGGRSTGCRRSRSRRKEESIHPPCDALLSHLLDSRPSREGTLPILSAPSRR